MQYRVPQNIDMEDKIVGPLTLKQFIFVAIGGSIIYILLTTLPMPLFIATGLPTAILILAFTFYKPQDQPFSHFILALISFITKPRERVWQKGSMQEAIILPHKEKRVEPTLPKKKISKSELQKLAQTLDSGGWKSLEKVETPHTTESMQVEQMKQAKELQTMSAPAPITDISNMKSAKPTASTPLPNQAPPTGQTPINNQPIAPNNLTGGNLGTETVQHTTTS
ncbi:MAG: PrgI family protein [Patescibacteria group bacterium]